MSFNSSKLSNGLSVVTYSMPHVNSVAINIIVKVGSRYENLQESGISHFLEHMAFKGTKSRSALDIAKEFDSIGGHFNAYTGKEQTVYYTKVLSSHTEQAMEILADILLNSLFDAKDIKKEFSVISQEIAAGKDNPDDLAYEKFFELAYGDHPLGRSILGTKENIAKFDKSSFQKYIEKHYHAGNIYVSIAGKIEHTDAVNLAGKLFAEIPPAQNNTCESAKYVGGFALQKKDLEQTTVILGFESSSYHNLKDFYHEQILSIIFGGGLSSRLFQKIREELGLAYSVGSWISAFSDSGIFNISAATDHDNLYLLLEQIMKEIKDIQLEISEEELIRAKAQIESNIFMAEERPEYKSEEAGKNFAFFGKYFPAEEVMQIVNETTIPDLIKTAEQIFNTKPSLSVIGPKNISDDFYKIKSNLF